MCGMSNSSVVPRIMYVVFSVVNNGDPELLVTNISISSKTRMTMSTLFMKFNLYGLVIAWIQEAHTSSTPCTLCVKMYDEQEQYHYPEDEEQCRHHAEVMGTIGSILVLFLK